MLYVVGIFLSFVLFVRLTKISYGRKGQEVAIEDILAMALASLVWPVAVPIAWAATYLEVE